MEEERKEEEIKEKGERDGGGEKEGDAGLQ